MKYIRTKAGYIYKVKREALYEDGLCYVLENGYAIDAEAVETISESEALQYEIH